MIDSTCIRLATSSPGSSANLQAALTETQETLGHKSPATSSAYVQRIAVKRDKFGEAIANRMKL